MKASSLPPVPGPEANPLLRLNRVLAPTDFSGLSNSAIDVAMSLVANRPEAAVTLLHVLEPLPLLGTVDCGIPPDITLSHRVDRAEREMQRLRTVHSSHPDLSTRVLVGNVANDICKIAAEEHFDLIVLSSHGRTGLPRILIGSVAERVVQEAPCPVLVVKPPRGTDGEFLTTPFHLGFKRLLVGFDHRSGACRALDVARRICRVSHGHITVVEALEGPPPHSDREIPPTEGEPPKLRELRTGLERLRTEHLPESADWEVRVAIGQPWEVITKTAKETGSDLIVVGPHEYTQWGHAFAGSTVQRVIRLAACPVLLVK